MTDTDQTAKNGLTHFVLDAKASRFTVQAFAAGILSAMGHNPTIGISKFSGDVDFSSQKAAASGLRLVIESSSLSVSDDISAKDRREIERLMKSDVLEVDRYPEVAYEAHSILCSAVGGTIYSATLNGMLKFHGVTQQQQITARITAMGETLRASGGFTLKQSDYQIKPVSVAGGALKLKDELKFSFEIVAREQN